MGTLWDIYSQGVAIAKERKLMKMKQQEFKASMDNEILRQKAYELEIKNREAEALRDKTRWEEEQKGFQQNELTRAQQKKSWTQQEKIWEQTNEENEYNKSIRESAADVKAGQKTNRLIREATLKNLQQAEEKATGENGQEFLKRIMDVSKIITFTGNHKTAENYLARSGVKNPIVEEQEGGTYSITGSDADGEFKINVDPKLLTESNGLKDPNTQKKYADMMEDVGKISRGMMEAMSKLTKEEFDPTNPNKKIKTFDKERAKVLKSVWLPERLKELRMKYADSLPVLETILSQNGELKYADQVAAAGLNQPLSMPDLEVDPNGDPAIPDDVFTSLIKANDQYPSNTPVITGSELSAPAGTAETTSPATNQIRIPVKTAGGM